MRMAAAATYMHTDSTHPSPSSWSIISSPPWRPAVAVPTNQQHQAAAGLYDPDLAATPPPPPRNNHHLRPGAARRPSSRRRPRTSRKLVTTYINADPASFRRMVHQATGADELLLPHEATLCRPAPCRTTPLATLDTSALLLGGGSAPRTSEVDFGAGGGVGVGLKGLGYGGGSGGFPTLESWDALSCTSYPPTSHP